MISPGPSFRKDSWSRLLSRLPLRLPRRLPWGDVAPLVVALGEDQLHRRLLPQAFRVERLFTRSPRVTDSSKPAHPRPVSVGGRRGYKRLRTTADNVVVGGLSIKE